MAEFRNSFRKILLSGGLAGLLFAFAACDDDDKIVDLRPSITVIMGKTGKGNNDYSALIYKTIEKWQKNPKVKMKVHFPKTNDEALKIYREWAKNSADDKKALMVPANGEYSYMVATEKLDLKENQQVLAFEMNLKTPLKGVHTFELSHSGVSYLTGKMASACQKAVILIGHRTPMLDEAAGCFKKGFGEDRPLVTMEIDAESFGGFNMAEKAKEMVREHKDAFILPLAGLSNNGVYEFLNECQPEDLALAAGMDVDCSALSRRIPFSYVVNIDKAVDLHFRCWYEDKPWPAPNMGLKEGMTAIVMNPEYTETGGITLSDFEKLYRENLQEAIEREARP